MTKEQSRQFNREYINKLMELSETYRPDSIDLITDKLKECVETLQEIEGDESLTWKSDLVRQTFCKFVFTHTADKGETEEEKEEILQNLEYEIMMHVIDVLPSGYLLEPDNEGSASPIAVEKIIESAASGEWVMYQAFQSIDDFWEFQTDLEHSEFNPEDDKLNSNLRCFFSMLTVPSCVNPLNFSSKFRYGIVAVKNRFKSVAERYLKKHNLSPALEYKTLWLSCMRVNDSDKPNALRISSQDDSIPQVPLPCSGKNIYNAIPSAVTTARNLSL